MAFYVGKTNLGPNFYPKLVQISSELGMKPEDILAVMVSESGIQNNIGEDKFRGGGLIGFLPSTQKMLGFKGSPEEFLQLTGEQQLDYVKKYLQQKNSYAGGPLKSAAQYYVGVLFPVALKLPGIQREDPNTVFIEKNPATIKDPATGQLWSKKYWDVGIKVSPSLERNAFINNPLFWRNGSVPGGIAYSDMQRQVLKNKSTRVYQNAIQQMARTSGYQSSDVQTQGSTLLAGDSITVPLSRFITGGGPVKTVAGVGRRASWLLDQLQKAVANGELSNLQNAVVLIGTNDLPSGENVDQVFSTIDSIWKLLKKNGIKVFAATIPPLRNWQSWTPGWEQRRKALNNLIINSSDHDGLIRLDTLLSDKNDPSRLAKEFDSGDGLHPRADKLGLLYSNELKRLSPGSNQPGSNMLASYKSKSSWFVNFLMQIEKFLERFIGNGSQQAIAQAPCKFLISIGSSTDQTDSIEFARILSTALQEYLGAKTILCGDSHNIELECNIIGDKIKLFNAIKELSNSLAEVFKEINYKRGTIEIFSLLTVDTKSDFKPISIKNAEINYRKFHLKIASNTK